MKLRKKTPELETQLELAETRFTAVFRFYPM
jgi:hypothetical protein